MASINTNPNDLWEKIGSMSEEELPHVLTRLFFTYEEVLQHDSGNPSAREFFQKLANAIDQTAGCNLNRR